MSKKNDIAQKKDEVSIATSSQATQTNDYSTNRKYMEQFADLTFTVGHIALNSLKENAEDYKAINEDKELSSVDKAIGKRKIILMDVGIGIVVLGTIWLGRKFFVV